MASVKLKQRVFACKAVTVLLFGAAIFSSSAFGEKLPIKHLTTADGLPQNTINSIHQDKKGFFWIGTNGGLARFDGYGFVNFTQNEGLPRNEVLDFLETREGDFWLATKGGLVKFNPEGAIYNRVVSGVESVQLSEMPLFTTYSLPDSEFNTVTKLLQDAEGIIWLGTEKGLFRLLKNGGEPVFSPVHINLRAEDNKYIHAVYEDRRGAVWVGTDNNLVRISTDNRVTTFRGEGNAAYFQTMFEDEAGNFWVGSYKKGLFRFAIDENDVPKVVRQFADAANSELENVDAIEESTGGKLWIGGSNGLYEFEPAANKLVRYTRTSGIGYYRFQALFEDRDGNLWLGTRTNGIYRLSAQGLISFGAEDRISFVRAAGFDSENNLILTAFVTNTGLDEQGAKVSRDIAGEAVPASEWRFGKLDGDGFSWIVPKFDRTVREFGSSEKQTSFQTRRGEWWIATGEGLFRFPKVAFNDLRNASPINVFDEKNGLNPADVFRIFEDSRGDVWIATSGTDANGFYKWERETETLRDVSTTTGLSAVKYNLIASFAEDGGGDLWIGFNVQGFGRIRGGKFEFFGDEQKIPAGGVSNLFFDRQNRLWVALRQGGVLRIDNPEAEPLNFVNYTQANGLSSNRTLSLTQDRQGFIYVGTDRDINRLNPQTLEVKHLILPDNQLQREYRSAICGADGTLWFGTTEGLVKYVPLPDKTAAPPDILLTGASVESIPQKISTTGATTLDLPTLSPQQTQVTVNYVSLSNLENDDIFYQYKLGEDENWSTPNKQRFVNFANLSGGNYRIYIRAVTSGGVSSENPAVVSFRILPPIYLRWWFVGFSLLLVGAIIYAFYRSRLQKLLEIERTRTLIATDLHDDIGSNLSKISVLSEVVRMRLNSENNEQTRLLDSIAETSRQSVSSMSDIVWAINPKRDSVLEMTRKMREHAEEIFVPKKVRVEFFELEQGASDKLPMDLRHDIYLVFKEVVNNVAKHSNCARVKIDFQIRNYEITLEIEDDGDGFIVDSRTGGNGLMNMQSRVEKLNGRFEIESRVKLGTRVKIRVPQN